MNAKIRSSHGGIGAASAGTDAESGAEGLAPDADVEKSLFALRVMRERGLIDEETYQARARSIAGAPPKTA